MGEPAVKHAHAQFQRETLAQVRASRSEAERVDELLERHWAEISHYPDIPVSVNWDFYEMADEMGKLRIFTVRIDGELVGYAVFMTNFNPHYMSSFQGVQDVLWLAPEHRRGLLGYRLIKYAEETLTAECQVLYHHQKIAHPALGRLLKMMGYEPVEVIWTKRLDKAG